MAEQKVYSVTEINRTIRQALEQALGRVCVEGEISNLSRPASGHLYFTIKDAGAQLSAVMFRGNQSTLTFDPKPGTQVQASGDITVYEKGGKYQIIVRKMAEGGQGSLHIQFEKLKKKLAAEGLFSEADKQALPLLAQRVGVVTSPTGAAVRDILNVVSRRYPNLHVQIAPVRVQGDGAAEEIAAAIELFNQRGEMDVIIVGRGGGSLEDLWCFNEEIVARAIAASRLPVISAVGHEIDFTISDFTADLRAPTPSAAAELVVGRKDEFEELLVSRQNRMAGAMQASSRQARSRLTLAAKSYVFKEPGNLVNQYRQNVDRYQLQLGHALQDRMRETRERLQRLVLRLEPVTRQRVTLVRQSLSDSGQRIEHTMKLRVGRVAQDVQRLDAQLKALSPVEVLERGYSLTRREDGSIVRDASTVTLGERLYTRMALGTVESEVKGVDDGKKEN